MSSTAEYKHFTYPFENFNPVQSLVLPHVDQDVNVLVASPTSSGKTICGELVAGEALANNRGKVIYTSPLKALVEEKLEDWTSPNHPWHGKKVFVMTGDYQMTPKRQEELDAADVIVSTYEMLAVRCRRQHLESTTWIKNAAVLIIDEAHFISSAGRGDHLEVALIGFARLNPAAKIVFLSATMRNVREMAEWLQELTGRQCAVVESQYRPCVLTTHMQGYQVQAARSWERFAAEREAIVEAALDLIASHEDDQWLLFAHSKTIGREMLKALSSKYPRAAAFHNADLSKDSRKKLENSFKQGTLRYLVATSTLAYGLNLPARRVCILGVKRGTEYVDPLDVIQECGRAGRPKYDPAGDAYVLTEFKDQFTWSKLLSDGIDVKSQLPSKLGFHLIGEIAEGRVTGELDSRDWERKTFYFKQKPQCQVAPNMFTAFKEHGLISQIDENWDDSEIAGRYKVTKLGRIASINYFDPFDVSAWKRNLVRLRGTPAIESSDAAIAWLFANVPSVSSGYVPKELKSLTNEFLRELRPYNLSVTSDGALARATILYNRIQGQDEVLGQFASQLVGMVQDAPRMVSCVHQIDSRVLGNRSYVYWEKVANRIQYGVGWLAADLCRLDGIGRVSSERLVGVGIESVRDFVLKSQLARELLSESQFDKAIAHAKRLERIDDHGDEADLLQALGTKVSDSSDLYRSW